MSRNWGAKIICMICEGERIAFNVALSMMHLLNQYSSVYECDFFFLLWNVFIKNKKKKPLSRNVCFRKILVFLLLIQFWIFFCWIALCLKYWCVLLMNFRSLAAEWGKYGMRFNVIQPGPIKTKVHSMKWNTALNMLYSTDFKIV